MDLLKCVKKKYIHKSNEHIFFLLMNLFIFNSLLIYLSSNLDHSLQNIIIVFNFLFLKIFGLISDDFWKFDYRCFCTQFAKIAFKILISLVKMTQKLYNLSHSRFGY